MEKREHYKLRATKHKITRLIKDDDYYTPKEIVAMFGEFDYDPATTSSQAEYLGIENYDTIETDGLSKDWTEYKRIWINPPFTSKELFLKKAVETYKKDNDIYIYCSLMSSLLLKSFIMQLMVLLELYIYRMAESSSLVAREEKRVPLRLVV